MKPLFRYSCCLLIVCLLAFMSGCKPNIQVSRENLAPGYQEDYISFTHQANLIHLNDSISELKLIFDADQFIFVREKPGEPFKAQVLVRALAFDSYDTDQWIDSTSLGFTIIQDSLNTPKVHYSLPLKIKTGTGGVVYLSISDLQKDKKQTQLIPVDKKTRFGAQWFSVDNHPWRIPSAFTAAPGNSVTFYYNGDSPEKLRCMLYCDSFSIPVPAYLFESTNAQKLDADSVFVPELMDANRHLYTTTLSKEGLYFFTADSDSANGFTIICTRQAYPDVNTYDAMAEPIRYISTQKEFKKMLEAENKTAAIEQFWLDIGKQQDHTRNLIRRYYSRVQIANTLFTSHTEGWKTDRGMIYIVFGPPTIVYRNSIVESWIYGEENNYFSITFNFKKMQNKFSNNDFVLERTPVYKDNWFRAVDIWRQ